MKQRYLIPALLSLGIAAPTVAVTQERDAERQQRVTEAEERLQEARRALEEAIRQLRLQEDDARSSLDRAIRELRRAERELTRGQFETRIRDFVVFPDQANRGLVRVFGDDRARMGVILGGEDDPAIDSIGARLTAVTPGGPAEEAGLRVGDIVMRVNGESVARTLRRGERPGEKLARIVRQHEEGDTLEIDYRRENENNNVKVVLQRLDPGAYSFAWSSDSSRIWLDADRLPRLDLGEVEVFPRVDVGPLRIRMPLRWLDMELVTLNEELGGYFGTTEGLLVVRAPSESSLNLRSGDVILGIDGRRPTGPSHALRIMRSYEAGESMQIEIMRNQRKTTVTATVPERE
jgi:S1-C subfamily serine protease